MKLHTKISYGYLYDALKSAKAKGLVGDSVDIVGYSAHRSNSHPVRLDFQLGTDDHRLPAGTVNQYGKNQKTRRVRNSGVDPELRYSATWHEWGWLMAEVYALDPDALFGDKSWGYNGVDDFHAKTRYQFS